MQQMTVTFTGWKAVLVLILVAGVAVFRISTARAKLDTQGRAALEAWVQADLARRLLDDTTIPLAERGAALTRASSVTIRSLAARGPLRGSVDPAGLLRES
jgi:hypothetical protein